MVLKRLIIALILLVLLVAYFLLFSKDNQDITGEYEFEKIATVSILSSTLGDTLEKQQVGDRYIIGNDSFYILGENICFQRENVTYKQEILDDEYIKDYWEDSPVIGLVKIIKQHEKRYRFVVYDENDELIPYYIFLLDDKLMIGPYDPRSKMELSTMNWVNKVE